MLCVKVFTIIQFDAFCKLFDSLTPGAAVKDKGQRSTLRIGWKAGFYNRWCQEYVVVVE